MAITLTKVAGPHSVGDRYRTIYKATMDSSYATGGEVLLPTDLGFGPGATADPEFHVDVQPLNAIMGQYDYTAQKLVAQVPVAIFTATFDPASLGAITSRDDAITVTGVAATDVCVRVEPPAAIASSVVAQGARVTGANTVTVRLTNASAGAVDVASGTWTFYIAAAAGAPHEVPSTSDLSAVSFRVEAYSKYLA